MRKLLFFSLVLFSGCSCLLSQVPPQYLNATQNCEAPLPDYRNIVTITDNCVLSSVLQTPEAGFILNSKNSPLTVNIKATDNSGNMSQVNFTVTLIDTIPPVITYDSLTVVNYQIIDDLYDKADLALLNMMKTFNEDSIYYNQNLQVTSAPARALNGGYRIWQFWDVDTINN